jgi:hypothetical protein
VSVTPSLGVLSGGSCSSQQYGQRSPVQIYAQSYRVIPGFRDFLDRDKIELLLIKNRHGDSFISIGQIFLIRY